MTEKKLVEHNALLQAIEMESPKREIMGEFGFKSLTSLKTAYLDALVALDKVPAANRKPKAKKVDKVVSVNSRGSLVIPKKFVDALGLDNTAPLSVKKEGTGFILKPAERRPKTILRKREA